MKTFTLTAFLLILVALLATPSFAHVVERGQGPALVARDPAAKKNKVNSNNDGSSNSTSNLSGPSSTAAGMGSLAGVGVVAIVVAAGMY